MTWILKNIRKSTASRSRRLCGREVWMSGLPRPSRRWKPSVLKGLLFGNRTVIITHNECKLRTCQTGKHSYIVLQITVPHNLPEFPSATSEKLDVARYACVFLLCRMKIHSALLVRLIFVCCTRPCQQSCRDGTRGGFSCQQREVRKGSFLLTAEQKQQKKKELDI